MIDTVEEEMRTLSIEELTELHRVGRSLELEDGEHIFERGDFGDAMYVIEAGNVDLVFEREKSTKSIGQLSFFGELALIAGRHRRSATAVARGSVRLLALDVTAFESLMLEQPRILFSLMQASCTYLLHSEENLIGELRRKNEALERSLDYLRRTREELDVQELLAQTDELTGLYNRRCLNRQMGKFIERAHRKGTSLALVLVDLDGLKKINDSLGHSSGDVVLRRTAEVIRGSVRRTDLACRIGGDEFALLFPETDEASSHRRAEAIRAAVAERPVGLKGTDLEISVSIGGALSRQDEDRDRLFERADKALYEAKSASRNVVRWSAED